MRTTAIGIFKKTALALLVLFLLFLLSGIVLTRFYGREITRYILEEVSNTLNFQIKVGRVDDLSFFKKFPFVSVSLYDVLVYQPSEISVTTGKNRRQISPGTDTLLFLQKAYLQFNLIDIINKNYRIKRISVADGFVRLINFTPPKTPEPVAKATSENPFLLKLSRMSVSNVDFTYLDDIKKQHLSFHCTDIVLKGDFYSEKFLMNVKGDVRINHAQSENVTWMQNRLVTLHTAIQVDNSKGSYMVKSGDIAIDRLNFGISGEVHDSSTSSVVNLKINGKNLDIPSVLNMLPENYQVLFSDYECSGNISFESKIYGEMNLEKNPDVEASFSLQHGAFRQKSTSYSLNNLRLDGHFSNGKKQNTSTAFVDISRCSATLMPAGSETAGGEFQVKFQIKNLSNPQISLSGGGRFDLRSVEKFIPVDTLDHISGMVNLEVQYRGALKNSETYTAQDFIRSQCAGKIIFSEVNFALKQSPLNYKNFEGNLALKNNDVLVNDLKGKLSSSEIEINGLLKNAFAWMFIKDEQLIIEAVLSADTLNLDELLADDHSAGDTSYSFAFPAGVKLNLNTDIGYLKFRKFNAAGLNCITTLSDNRLFMKNFSFSSMSGIAKGFLSVDASVPAAILISSEATLENMDMQRMFYEFENFGQEVITDRHLRGTTTASVRFAMMMDSSLNVNQDKIHALADITIDKGELIGFEPMSDISGYVKDHFFLKRIIKADELENKLKHIRFSTMKNQVEIGKGKIVIPHMTIQSSALNMEAEGIHAFDNTVDYKINFFLSDLLTKKTDVNEKEFGEIEDDGTGKKKIFLTVTGSMDDPQISYDRKSVKKDLSAKAQQEKKAVKGILKEELGWFKNDSSAKKMQKNNREDFSISWDDGNAASDSSSFNKHTPELKKNQSSKREIKNAQVKKILNKIGEEKQGEEENIGIEKGEDY